ncbi:MAG: hypothetical protein PHP97_01590 [Candidatus Shapirobacteria bacterium]|nr:hypothetical protein [Candidatus Shapirobacteria bacterium]MDD4382952.1 hypothetical protein [Candidatus Shapirobacteria bacterium]
MKKITQKSIFFLIGIFLLLIIGITILIENNKNKESIKIKENTNLCQRAGCSGQLCVESNFKDTATTCEWKEEYTCYQKAKCEKQSDGKCGFTKDDQFNKCVDESMVKIEK